MDIIEYENGLPKGYLQKRKKKCIIYVLSLYLYCLLNTVFQINFILVNNDVVLLISGLLIVLSCILLCNCVIAARNFKGIDMYNFSEIKVFTRKEKLVLILPVIIFVIIIPLKLFAYGLIVVPTYLIIKRFSNPPDETNHYGPFL